jgi:hypothetical protein
MFQSQDEGYLAEGEDTFQKPDKKKAKVNKGEQTREYDSKVERDGRNKSDEYYTCLKR